jgi:hypothetical protein
MELGILQNKVVSSFLSRLLVLMIRCGIRRLLEVLLVNLSWRKLVVVDNSSEAFFNKQFAWVPCPATELKCGVASSGRPWWRGEEVAWCLSLESSLPGDLCWR